jgi:hypothetical protein
MNNWIKAFLAELPEALPVLVLSITLIGFSIIIFMALFLPLFFRG